MVQVRQKAGAQREIRLALIGQFRRDKTIAMRLIAQIEKELDISRAAAAAIHIKRVTRFHMRSILLCSGPAY